MAPFKCGCCFGTTSVSTTTALLTSLWSMMDFVLSFQNKRCTDVIVFVARIPNEKTLNNFGQVIRRKGGGNFPFFVFLAYLCNHDPRKRIDSRSRNRKHRVQPISLSKQRIVQTPKNAAPAAASKHAAAKPFTSNRSLTNLCLAAAVPSIWSRSHTAAASASAFTNFVTSMTTNKRRSAATAAVGTTCCCGPVRLLELTVRLVFCCCRTVHVEVKLNNGCHTSIHHSLRQEVP